MEILGEILDQLIQGDHPSLHIRLRLAEFVHRVGADASPLTTDDYEAGLWYDTGEVIWRKTAQGWIPWCA